MNQQGSQDRRADREGGGGGAPKEGKDLVHSPHFRRIFTFLSIMTSNKAKHMTTVMP
jgi:hypothetical protein